MTTAPVIGAESATRPRGSQPKPTDIEQCRELLAENGYLIFRGLVPREPLSALRRAILDEFDEARRTGRLFSGGGTASGHLNCFPGEQSRFVYRALEEQGVFALVRAIASRPLRQPNIGCNLNLPNSKPQNYHIDGYFSSEFPIVNVAAVDTDLVNGALDVLEATHRRPYKYWELVLESPRSIRVPLEQGDVLVRTSVLWHRGMPNHSPEPRPMLAFTWEDGGSTLEDPYAVNDGKIGFFPNRYATTFAGRVRERAFASAPRLGSAYLFVRSLLRDRAS